jgi:hypothetical protein
MSTPTAHLRFDLYKGEKIAEKEAMCANVKEFVFDCQVAISASKTVGDFAKRLSLNYPLFKSANVEGVMHIEEVLKEMIIQGFMINNSTVKLAEHNEAEYASCLALSELWFLIEAVTEPPIKLEDIADGYIMFEICNAAVNGMKTEPA